jgi:hypothetical protein
MSGERSFLAQHMVDYPELHRDRFNLAIHVFLVPMFQAGIVTAIAGAALRDWRYAAAGLASSLVSIVLQGRGHAREEKKPTFGGPLNVVARIFAEQFVTFPRFVLGGGWLRAWRASAQTR